MRCKRRKTQRGLASTAAAWLLVPTEMKTLHIGAVPSSNRSNALPKGVRNRVISAYVLLWE